MDPKAIVTGLARVAPRGPGTDAERRAAQWLRQVLRDDLDREVVTETVWVRPQRAAVLALHAALGVAASVVAASRPAIGLGVAAVALVSWCLDALGWAHIGRRLTPARATQNLISPPTAATRSGRKRIVRLIITAPYDAPYSGIAGRELLRRPLARLRALTGGHLPGSGALVALALAAITGLAGARLDGIDDSWVGAVQLVPTVVLLAVLGLSVDAALSRPGPGANDPASGTGVAIALAAELDREPPRHMGVEVVLAGAGSGPALGMRDFARGRRKAYRAEATAVVNLAACGRGRPRWWVSDGPLLPLRYHPRLRELAAREGGGAPFRGHGATGGWRARLVHWPTITVGCLEDEGPPSGSGQAADTPDGVDPVALRGALDVALRLVRALDEDLAARAP